MKALGTDKYNATAVMACVGNMVMWKYSQNKINLESE